MRITFVLPTVNMSGGIRVAAIYAEELSRLGHQVTVVSPPARTVPVRRRVKALLSGAGWPSRKPGPSHLDGRGLDHRVLDRWRPVCDADVPDADVVIATWWETAEWVNALSPRKGAKAYLIQHHEVFGNLPVERCRATYRFPMHKIVIARWLKDVMRDEYGDDDVDLVHNSVDHAQFFAPERGKQPVPTVGILYSTVGFKAADVALAAIEKVRSRVADLRVVSFGAERPGEKIPLPPYAAFTFSPPQHRLRELYAACDVWIAASRTEGFNLPPLEAMACRTPVVSTRAGWPEEAIETGVNGVLVDVDDVDGLAHGLEWVLTLPDQQWREVSRAAYETATRGSWADSARRLETALIRAIERSRSAAIAA